MSRPDIPCSVCSGKRCAQRVYTPYGSTNSRYGWEVDHIKPVAKGGKDDLSNLQPLQWDNNRKKARVLDSSCSTKGNRSQAAGDWLIFRPT